MISIDYFFGFERQNITRSTALKDATTECRPKGSDNVTYHGKTGALSEAWDTYPEVAEKGKSFFKVVEDLAAVTGNGVDSLMPGHEVPYLNLTALPYV